MYASKLARKNWRMYVCFYGYIYARMFVRYEAVLLLHKLILYIVLHIEIRSYQLANLVDNTHRNTRA